MKLTFEYKTNNKFLCRMDNYGIQQLFYSIFFQGHREREREKKRFGNILGAYGKICLELSL